MAQSANFDIIDRNHSFVDTNDDEIEQIIIDSKSKNTQKSTNTALSRFKTFLTLCKYSDVDEIPDEDLPQILTKFHTDVRTKKTGENYKTSSFKVIRAGLNRYFKVKRSIDIVSDERFTRANLAFDGVQVKAKKMGKGVVNSTPHISKEDLSRISAYFNIDHMKMPNPKVLQQCVQFYIMYFFCRRGQENLYTMTKDHFEVVVDYSGKRFIVRAIDEKDKNHGINDTEIANQGRIYEDPGKLDLCSFFTRHCTEQKFFSKFN